MPAKTKPRLSLRAFKSRFDTDEKCREFLEHAVWGDAPACRHCGALKVWRIKGKSARPGLIQCGERGCGKQSTVTVGTVFHDTHLPLTKWFLAIYLLAETSKGVSANWLKDAIGVTYKTAWHLGHRIRRMMDGDGAVLLTGIVEADETYVGGKRRRGEPPRKRGRGTPKKPVFVAVQRGGEVRAAVMDAVTAEAVKAHLDRWADRNATLMTDELNVYGGLKRFWRWHFTVAHGEGEFHRAEDAAHVNTAESFNATLKRAHVGVYHYMSPKHLLRYVSECVFRWNGRKRTTLGRLAMVLQNSVARPLPYRALVS